jgi:hypothetical protein
MGSRRVRSLSSMAQPRVRSRPVPQPKKRPAQSVHSLFAIPPRRPPLVRRPGSLTKPARIRAPLRGTSWAGPGSAYNRGSIVEGHDRQALESGKYVRTERSVVDTLRRQSCLRSAWPGHKEVRTLRGIETSRRRRPGPRPPGAPSGVKHLPQACCPALQGEIAGGLEQAGDRGNRLIPEVRPLGPAPGVTDSGSRLEASRTHRPTRPAPRSPRCRRR